jgi:hypothetical protein
MIAQRSIRVKHLMDGPPAGMSLTVDEVSFACVYAEEWMNYDSR